MTENFRLTTLPNGLRVATDAMPHVETATIGVWTSCGSRHEPAPINGVAHFLEHMLFQGTTRRTAQAIAEEMEAVGGQMNAFTGRENTAYYARVLKHDAPLALDMLADVLQHSIFAEAAVAKERHVILQELGQAMDTPDDIIFDHLHAAAFPGQAAGRAILGDPDTIGAITPAVLQGYIRSHYAPSRLVLAAAGAIDHDWLVGAAGHAFATLPETDAPVTEATFYRGGEYREKSDLEQVHLVLGFGGIGLGDPDYHAAQVFATALGGGASSRLFQEIREKRGLVYTIHAFQADFVETGLFGIYCGTGGDSLGELIPVLCDQIAASRDGFTPAEITRARAQLKSGALMGLESSYNRAETLAFNHLQYGRAISVAEIVAMIDAVGETDLARVAKRMLDTPVTVAALGPLGRLESYDRIVARCAA